MDWSYAKNLRDNMGLEGPLFLVAIHAADKDPDWTEAEPIVAINSKAAAQHSADEWDLLHENRIANGEGSFVASVWAEDDDAQDVERFTLTAQLTYQATLLPRRDG